jgi:hypothetical protein
MAEAGCWGHAPRTDRNTNLAFSSCVSSSVTELRGNLLPRQRRRASAWLPMCHPLDDPASTGYARRCRPWPRSTVTSQGRTGKQMLVRRWGAGNRAALPLGHLPLEPPSRGHHCSLKRSERPSRGISKDTQGAILLRRAALLQAGTRSSGRFAPMGWESPVFYASHTRALRDIRVYSATDRSAGVPDAPPAD